MMIISSWVYCRAFLNIGIIIIGDEVLKAQTAELNIDKALKAFRGIGLPVVRVSIIRDKENEIKEEVLLQVKFLIL